MKIFDKYRNVSVEMKASVAYTICNIITNSIGFITLPLFTRLLTTEQYGQYSVYASWSGIFVILITLNLPYGSFSKAMLKYKDDRNGYISSIQGICLLLGIVFLLIYLVFHEWMNQWIKLPTILIVFMVIEIVANFAIQCWFGKQRFEYKYVSVIIVTIINALLAPLLAIFMVVQAEEKGVARILGYAIVTIVIGGSLYCYNMIKGKRVFCKEYWRYAFQFNLPLLLYYASQAIFNQSDRIMIEHYCGKTDAAIYSVAYSLGILLNFVLAAIGNSYVPWIYLKIKENSYQENRKVTCSIAILMAVLLLMVIWIAPEAILIMAGKAYSNAMWAVPPVAVSVLLLFYTQIFVNIEFYYEKKMSLILGSVGAAVINIILNAIFIPMFGFTVAAYTTLISYVVFAATNGLCVRKYMKQGGSLEGFINLKGLLTILMVFVILGFAGMFLYPYFGIRMAVIALMLVVCVVFRRKIVLLIKSIKR